MTAARRRDVGSTSQYTVLLLIERRGSRLRGLLTKAGYRVVDSFTTDHAVAVCVNNPVDAVILDQDCFVETDGWSVAQSIKAAKPNLCVLLVWRAKRISKRMPKGVDAISSDDKPAELLAALGRLLRNTAAQTNSKIIRSEHPVSLDKWFKGMNSPQ